MVSTLLQILIATTVVSVFALIGIFTIGMKEKILKKVLLFLVALSAGAMIGGAFLHLLPEAIHEVTAEVELDLDHDLEEIAAIAELDNVEEELHEEAHGHGNKGVISIFIYLLIGFSIFFLVEKVLHWHHCHKPHHHKNNKKVESFAIMNLVGDGIHNFIDGLIIAVAFLADTGLGITTTIAVGLHEIPQEISDFGVLIYGGYSKAKALLLNLVTAAMAILGGVLGFFLSGYIESALSILLPIAAGGFIYIAASDLIPELKKEEDLKKSMMHFGVFALGIVLMYGLLFLEAAH